LRDSLGTGALQGQGLGKKGIWLEPPPIEERIDKC